jgi:hypothetical protein
LGANISPKKRLGVAKRGDPSHFWQSLWSERTEAAHAVTQTPNNTWIEPVENLGDFLVPQTENLLYNHLSRSIPHTGNTNYFYRSVRPQIVARMRFPIRHYRPRRRQLLEM